MVRWGRSRKRRTRLRLPPESKSTPSPATGAADAHGARPFARGAGRRISEPIGGPDLNGDIGQVSLAPALGRKLDGKRPETHARQEPPVPADRKRQAGAHVEPETVAGIGANLAVGVLELDVLPGSAAEDAEGSGAVVAERVLEPRTEGVAGLLEVDVRLRLVGRELVPSPSGVDPEVLVEPVADAGFEPGPGIQREQAEVAGREVETGEELETSTVIGSLGLYVADGGRRGARDGGSL